MKHKPLLVLTLLTLLLSFVPTFFAPTQVQAASIVLSASQDTYIRSGASDDVNYGSSTYMSVGVSSFPTGCGGEACRALLEFTVWYGGEIPSGSQITSAYLQLYYYAYETNNPTGRTLYAQRLKSECNKHLWVESVATWNIYKYASNWGDPGASSTAFDYTTTNQASATVPVSYGWMSWDVTAQVQYALDEAIGTVEMRVVDPLEGSCGCYGANCYGMYFRSREYSAYRPRLIINYNVASGPSVTTDSYSSVQPQSATAHGTITSIGSGTVTRRGFKYGLTQTDTWDSYETGTFSTGSYSRNLTGLSPDTTYWFRVYATNSYGTGYGAWMSFTTTTGMPIVTTDSAYPYGNGCWYATLFGTIVDEGDSGVFKRGFQYGLDYQNPVGNVYEYGSFSIGGYNLTTGALVADQTYYYRAYAVNTQGTGYGEWKTFLTTAGGCIPIHNVDELQDMSNNLTACYYLVNDIDASATSGWNGGLGFEPVGQGTRSAIEYPTSDISSSGSWTINPADGVIYTKIDDGVSHDGDTTYVQGATNASFMVGIDGMDIDPSGTGFVVMIYHHGKRTSVNTCQIQRRIRIWGTDYNVGNVVSVTSTVYASYGGAIGNPLGGDWTPDVVEGIEGFGITVVDGTANYRLTNFQLGVSYDLEFTGSLDGKGHVISGLYESRNGMMGLFGEVNGDTFNVQDLSLTSVNMTNAGSFSYGGALVAYLQGGTVDNVYVDGTVSTGSTAGGLAGYIFSRCNVTITDCITSGSVISSSDAAGGLVGDISDWGGYITLQSCGSTCTVTGHNEVGGLLGRVDCPWDADYFHMYNCYATGDVTGTSPFGGNLGGLVGTLYFGHLSQCYATGNVYGYKGSWVGGLIGDYDIGTMSDCYARGDILISGNNTWAGGLLGDTEDVVIQRCYSTGEVPEVAEYVGGLAASNDGSTFSDCFWDTDTSGTLNGVDYGDETGVTGANTTAMKTIDTYSGWDILNTTVPLNDGYPFLHWQIGDSPTIWYIYGEGLPSGAPAVVTYAATSIGSDNATLNGGLISLGNYTDVYCYFEWGLNTSYEYSTTPQQHKTSTGSFSKLIIGLSSNTTYHFRAAGDYADGTAYGNDRTFTTLAEGEEPETQFDLIVSSTDGGDVTTPGEGIFTYASGANVNLVATPDLDYSFVVWTGDVDTIIDVEDPTTTITMNGDCVIMANFVYSELCSLAVSSTVGGSVVAPGEGTFAYPLGTVVNIIAIADSGYWFSEWIGNVGGIANVLSFNTTINMLDNYAITANFVKEEPPEPNTPTVVTGNVTSTTMMSTTLHGALTSMGNYTPVYVFFQYGLNTSYGTNTPMSPRTSIGNFSRSIGSLVSNTTYHYRAAAKYNGYVYGDDETFTTLSGESEEPPGYEYNPCDGTYEYESYTTGDNETATVYGAYWFAQTFTPTESFKISSIRLKLSRNGTAGALTVSLRDVDVNGKPAGVDLVSASYEGTGTSTGWYEITMPTYRLETDEYAIVVRAIAGDASNYISWYNDPTGIYTGGTYVSSSNSGVSWSVDEDKDFMFQTFGTSTLCIMDVKVFSSYLEDDDWLIAIHYLNEFPPYYGVATPSDYFDFQLVVGGEVVASVGVPLWGHMPGSIYLSQELADTLEWGSTYTIRMRGSFDPYPTATYTLIPADWRGQDLNLLDAWVFEVANAMSTYYEQSMTTYLGRRLLLNDAGSALFATGIPMLAAVRPLIFLDPELYTPESAEDWQRNYENAQHWQEVLGTKIATDAETAGNIFGVTGQQFATVAFFGTWLVASLGSAMFAGIAALVVSLPFLAGGWYAGLISTAFFAVLGSLFVLVLVWYFWIRGGG